MWPNTYENWGHFGAESRTRVRPQDIDVEAILAEARRMRSAETARFAAKLGRGLAWAWNSLIAQPVIRAYRRNRLEAELLALSDQMLADIGIVRSDIAKIARDAYRPRQDRTEPLPKTLYEVTRKATDVPTKRAA